MKNSMVMFIFPVFDRKYFRPNLEPSNLEPRLIRICRIQCWFWFCLDRKYPFWDNLVQKFKSQFKKKFGIVYNLSINYLNLMMQSSCSLVLFSNVFRNTCSWKFRNIYRKRSVSESLNKVAGLEACKETPAQVFSCEYCKIFMNTFFTEHHHWLLLLF